MNIYLDKTKLQFKLIQRYVHKNFNIYVTSGKNIGGDNVNKIFISRFWNPCVLIKKTTEKRIF